MLRRHAFTCRAARWINDESGHALHLPYDGNVAAKTANARAAETTLDMFRDPTCRALAREGRPMNWHHSGLEGLCGALAGAFDDAPKAQFARDLFNDAATFDKAYNATRIWTLSRVGRIGKFEEAWTGRDLPAKKRNLLTAKRALERFAESLTDQGRCSELRFALTHGYNDGKSATDRLHSTVLGAMAAGFAAERYGAATIAAFASDMDALALTWNPADDASTKEVATRLVAAAIYGPDHPLALSDETEKTDEDPLSACDRLFEHASTSSVVVSHIYDGVAAKMGACRRHADDQIVLLGRSSRMERYRARIDQLGIDGLSRLLDSRETEIVRIPELHGRVSSCHGALACEAGTWYYYDLGSTNGTLVSGGDRSFAVDGLCEVHPGDVLFLGVEDERNSDDVMFWSAAALLVSMSIDPGCLE